MSNESILSNFYTWIFVLSLLGGILFLFTEFAGYTAPPYNYWYSISLESGFHNPDHAPFAPVFILVAGLFFFNTLISLMKLNLIKFEVPNAQKLGLYSSVGILVISVVAGIAFEVMLAESGATDWWFNTGFYAGVIGGILMAAIYYLMRTRVQ
jgi:hypothetical protein